MRVLPARLLPETVHVETPGPDFGDGPEPGVKVPHRARVERENRLVRSATGTEVVATATVTMRPGTIAAGDRLYMPGDPTGAAQVIAIREQWDRSRVVAVVVDVA